MQRDPGRSAQLILATLGGPGNVVRASHCATRLRLLLRDDRLVDENALQELEEVQGVYRAGGQIQIIIGTDAVEEIYERLLQETGLTASTCQELSQAAAARQPLWRRILKALGDVFVPLLPAFVAQGLLVGLVETAGAWAPGVTGSGWYVFLDTLAGMTGTFLPVLVAASAAQLFGGSLCLGALVGLCAVSEPLQAAWALVGWPAGQTAHPQRVLPVILAVWLLCRAEHWLKQHLPGLISFFMVPAAALLAAVAALFLVLDPVFSLAEGLLLALARSLITMGGGLGAAVVGLLYPVTVVSGLHHMYLVIETGLLAESGVNILMPLISAANFAQCGACLAAAFRSRQARMRQTARQAALSAALGITEPAIFGVNLRCGRPFLCALAGSAAGAAFAAVTGAAARSYGLTSALGILLVDRPFLPAYLGMLAVSGGAAFALACLTWQEQPDPARTASRPAPDVITCEAGTVAAPVRGRVIPLEQIADPTIASGKMGAGVGIEPSEGVVYAPFDGCVTALVGSGHAIGLTSDDGMRVLIHVGIDTVDLRGSGFVPLVQQDERVRRGQRLMLFDRSSIHAAGLQDTVAVILTNSASYEQVETFVQAVQDRPRLQHSPAAARGE